MHLVDRIDRWAQAAGDRLAHISGGRTLTYADSAAVLMRWPLSLAGYCQRTNLPWSFWGTRSRRC